MHRYLYKRTYPIYIITYTYTHPQTHIYTHTYKHNYTQTHIYIYINSYKHMHTYTHIHKHTRMHNYKKFSHTHAHILADNTYVHLKKVHILVHSYRNRSTLIYTCRHKENFGSKHFEKQNFFKQKYFPCKNLFK